MLGKIFGIICIAAIICAALCGNLPALGGAVLDGARGAVTLSLSLLGMSCLWCGVMRVLREAGVLSALSRVISPLIKIFFPDTYKSGIGKEEICANIAANLLGIGNAATPAALAAMEKLQKQNDDPERASRDMITLAVLNTSSIALLPTTVITLLRAAGAQDPFKIILPVWLCSACCSITALVLCRICGEIYVRVRKKGRDKGRSRIAEGNTEKTGLSGGNSYALSVKTAVVSKPKPNGASGTLWKGIGTK